jgi:ribulose bisphosphate carboxylase small subunit
VVTGSGEEITGIWLESASRDLGAPIPAQIADRLRGREFASFDRFREAFWLEVSGDHTLLSQFKGSNQELIKQGYAPFARFRDQAGGREKYEIHHLEEIQNGGAVYDLDNMTITTPRNHIRIHSKGNL